MHIDVVSDLKSVAFQAVNRFKKSFIGSVFVNSFQTGVLVPGTCEHAGFCQWVDNVIIECDCCLVICFVIQKYNRMI